MSQHSGSKGPKRGGIGLNIDQSKAARKALAARDYLLISGKPGTGKTTAIVVLIHMLITSGKTVLVTAYTHSAVDNICLKLKERGIDFLRVGGKHQVHPDIHSYIPNYEKNVKTFADIERKY
jgi:DNA replication ATP-dependent helicase Dna2